jgi:uncharacterized protein YjiS (DUF1127 family)
LGEDLSRLRQQATRLRKERDHLETLVVGVGPMIEGSLVKRYTVCGKKGCRCLTGKKHGPFLYLTRLVEGKLKTRYVRKGSWVLVRQMVERYRRFRQRRRKIRELTASIEAVLEDIRAVQERELEEVQGR